jgi:hypothetical protein
MQRWPFRGVPTIPKRGFQSRAIALDQLRHGQMAADKIGDRPRISDR